MRGIFARLACSVIAILGLAACQAQPRLETTVRPNDIRFSGDRALELERQFVQQFPGRHSGTQNNRLAAEWLMQQFMLRGLDCSMDEWQIINYSQPVTLNNAECVLPGRTEQEILIIAHLDQAPTTVQGADNDGSGIGIQLQLAEIFAAEGEQQYTMAFVSTDAEEYGMLGSGRYIRTHPNPENVLVGMSLDNLGRPYYDGMAMELIGQFDGYGPIWLALALRDAAEASGAEWPVILRSPFDQITDQAAPVSFMDQGPLVASGVPAIGLTSHVPPEFADAHFDLWHDPSDTLEMQSAQTLEKSGMVAEAFVRELMSMESFPHESGPYLYFDESGRILRGAPLLAIFVAFLGVFLAGSLYAGRRMLAGMVGAWREAAPHFLALWLPLAGSVLLLYAMVAVGLMDTYHRYPATSKDPLLYHPRWPAVLVYVVGLAAFVVVARRLAARTDRGPSAAGIKSLALVVIAIGGAYVLLNNPFGLFFMVPLLFWLLIGRRRGWGRAVDVGLFALGGLFVYALIYIFGFQVLRLNFAMLWYLMNMFSTRMISFPMAAVIMAMLAAGLTMIVDVPRRAKAT